MALSPVEVARHAQRAGFRGNDLVRAVAHAGAESSFDPNATNNIGAGHTGLWQISGVHLRDHPQWTRAWLKNPANNAVAAYTLFRQSGWQPWLATAGRRLLYMKTAEDAVRQIGETNVDPTTIGGAIDAPDLSGGMLGTAKQAIELAVKAGNWINDPSNWLRVLYVGLGGILVVSALIVVVLPAVQSTAKTATKVATKGIL